MGNGRSRGIVLPAYYGLLIALAFVFSYIESLIPFSVGVPGVKLGLGNLVSVITLYTLGWQAAAAVSLVRVILTGFTFGSMSCTAQSMHRSASAVSKLGAEKT